MIGYLRGSVLRSEPGLVLLDVGGVGYQLHVPLSTYYELQKLEARGEAELFVHTHVREDALQLFGFWSDRERRLFLKLIGITGIGPRLAQTILSGMSPEDLVDALARGDLRRLNGIPGVGKKTAERMVLELRDKVRDLVVAPEHQVPAAASTDGDLVDALVNLGYKRAQAERALDRARGDQADLPAAERLKAALKLLSRT